MIPVRLLRVCVLVLFAITAVLFFPFTAEDAFITYRYAANLATLGEFVFNAGEPILALTSPLHGLLTSAMFGLTGDPIVSNKIFSIVLLLIAAALLFRRYSGRPRVQLLALALALLPPCVLLWTFGGLETPLLLVLATSLVVVADVRERPGLGRVCAVALLAGVAFVTRFDSVLFTLPVVAFVLWRSASPRDVSIALAVGAILPLTWIIVSMIYYGDMFPTSYYAKTPQRAMPVVLNNTKYVVSYLGFVGILPVLALLAVLLRTPGHAAAVLLDHARGYWWLYCAVGAQLAYGLTMATTHMMFSFRFFVPYLPAAAILLSDLVGDVLDRPPDPYTPRRQRRLVEAGIAGLVLLQAVQVVVVHQRSVNGLSRHGEYPWVGVAQYTTFVRTLRSQGEDIRRHWESLEDRPDRLPRIFTYAGGVVPYTFRESYVYETLVSYRHCSETHSFVEAPNVWMRTTIDLRRSADYVHLITPRHGELAPQLPFPVEHYELISSYEFEFDRERENFLVFYNPTPDPHRLAPRIEGGCSGVSEGRTADAGD